MAEKVPIRGGFNGGSLTGLAQFASGDTLGVAHGGTGVVTIGSNALVTGNGTSAMTSESNLTFDGTILKSTGDLCATVKVVSPALCIGSEYVLPTADGSAGQLMCTDGSGALAFATVSAGVTLAGSTNNTVATVTGSNALAGEANLTFNGTTLNVIGNAGVGIARTEGTLHVHTATAGSVSPNANEDDLVVENSTHGGITILTPDANDSSLVFGSPSDAVGAVVRWNHDADLFRILTANAGASMTLETGAGVEAMRITSAGNVGIGTTAPGAKFTITNADSGVDNADGIRLDITGNTAVGLDIWHSHESSGQTYFDSRRNDDNSNMHFRSKTAIGSIVNIMTLTGAGKVGIGTTASNAQVTMIVADMNGDTAPNPFDSKNVLIGPHDSKGVWFGYDNTNNVGHIGALDSGVAHKKLALNGDGGGGNVGIHTSNPLYSLHVNNQSSTYSTFITNTHASTPHGIGIGFLGAAPDNHTSHFFHLYDTGADRLVIWSDGDVENADNSYGALSDLKLKQDITDVRDYWDDFKAIRFRKFKFKTDVAAYGDDAQSLFGVVAQEAETVFPSLVRESPDREFQDVAVLDEDGNPTYQQTEKLDDDGNIVLDDDGIAVLIDDTDKPITEERPVDLGTTTKGFKYSILGQIGLKVVQELQARLEAAEAEIAILKG